MILSDEYVLRAMELRVKTKPIVGTLCSVEDPTLVWNAMKYFQCYNHGKYISHPFVELDEHIYQNMSADLFRIYAELLSFWHPPCTQNEIRSTMVQCKNFGYSLTQNKNRIALRKTVHEQTHSSRLGNSTYGSY